MSISRRLQTDLIETPAYFKKEFSSKNSNIFERKVIRSFKTLILKQLPPILCDLRPFIYFLWDYVKLSEKVYKKNDRAEA